MKIYVSDTHTLVWFIAKDSRMSQNAQSLLEQAERAEIQVLVPTLVLAELTHIAQKKKVEVSIDELLDKMEQGDGFDIVPFDLRVFQLTLQLPSEWEIHDRIIAATAKYYQAKLITKDTTLAESREIETVW